MARLAAAIWFISLLCAGCAADNMRAPATVIGIPETRAAPGITIAFGEASTIASHHASVTVLGYASPVDDVAGVSAPPAGKMFTAADIQACSVPLSAEGASIDPAEFRLRLPDGSVIRPQLESRQPALTATSIDRGKCVSGWVTFVVPNAVSPDAVMLDGQSEIEWRVP